MNKIEKREIKDELKYKNTVVLTYKIEYAQITETEYEIGKRNFNYYNKKKL